MLKLQFLRSSFRQFSSQNPCRIDANLKPSQLLVRVTAETVRYNYNNVNVPDFGKEIVGLVETTGPDSDFEHGERVFAGVSTATCTDDLVLLHNFDNKVLKMPENLETEFALASVANYALGYLGLKRLALEKQGNHILLLGRNRSLSAAVADLAENLFECEVTGVSESALARKSFQDCGCHATADWTSPDFVDQVLAKSFGQGADFVIDTVGGPAVRVLQQCTKPGGHVLLLDQSSGRLPELDAAALVRRGLAVSALGLAAHPSPAEVRDAFHMALQILASGMPRGVAPLVVKRRDQAQRVFADNSLPGQVVLRKG